MEPNFLSLLGLGFFLLAFFGAWRIRRDLDAGETSFERALFGRGQRFSRRTAPVRYWSAIVVNTTIVLLFALVGAAVFRATAVHLDRLR